MFKTMLKHIANRNSQSLNLVCCKIHSQNNLVCCKVHRLIFSLYTNVKLFIFKLMWKPPLQINQMWERFRGNLFELFRSY